MIRVLSVLKSGSIYAMLSGTLASLGIIAADAMGVPEKAGVVTLVAAACGAVGVLSKSYFSTRSDTIRAHTEARLAADKTAADTVAAAILQTAEIHKSQIAILTDTYKGQVVFLQEAIKYNRERGDKADARADRAEALRENVREIKHTFGNELARVVSHLQVLQVLLREAGGDVPEFTIRSFQELCGDEDKNAQRIVATALPSDRQL